MKQFLLLLLLTIISCQPIPPVNYDLPDLTPPVEDSPPAEVAEGHQASTPIGPEYPVADVKKVFTVKITDTNYTVLQKIKIREAESLIADIFNSEDYKKAVLFREFTSTKFSSLEVYEKLFKGAEALLPAVNYQMDLTVTMYNKKLSRVIGYTTAKSMIVHTNLKFHKDFTACQVASNLVHEWTHKMGFDHSSSNDSTSVPYSHSDIVTKLCPKFIKLI